MAAAGTISAPDRGLIVQLAGKQFFHHRPQLGLALEADAWRVGHRHAAVDNRAIVGEAAERREDLRIGFVAAALQADGDVERELVAAMRHAAARRPAVGLQHLDRAQILDQAVGEGRVELQDIAVGPEPAVTDQVPRILHREEILAGCEWRRVLRREGSMRQIVEGIERLFVPAQADVLDGAAELDRRR